MPVKTHTMMNRSDSETTAKHRLCFNFSNFIWNEYRIDSLNLTLIFFVCLFIYSFNGPNELWHLTCTHTSLSFFLSFRFFDKSEICRFRFSKYQCYIWIFTLFQASVYLCTFFFFFTLESNSVFLFQRSMNEKSCNLSEKLT